MQEQGSLAITRGVRLPLNEVAIDAVRASGPGGQRVNKAATAAHLRFDIRASSLPEDCKQRLMAMRDRRISRRGVVIIKAGEYRWLAWNRSAALQRLSSLLASAATPRRPRIPTRPGAAAARRRLAQKRSRRLTKARRRQPPLE